MEMDPRVVGRMEGDDQDYAGPLHATPDFTVDRPHYLADDLHRFRSNTDETALFDAALEYITDRTLSAEVYRYRQASLLIAILVTFCFGLVSSRVPIGMSFALTCCRLCYV